MSESPQDPPFAPRPSFSLARVLLVAVPLVAVGWWALKYSENMEQGEQAKLERTIFTRLLGAGEAATLAKAFKDADGDLVADPPAADQLQDPQEINFSYIASGDTDKDEETWKEFAAALAERLGRPVSIRVFSDVDEQMRALRDGELHVTAFATGEVEGAVNEAGFVPAACFADKDGNYHYTMKIIVPADSDVKEVKDLKPAVDKSGAPNKRRITFVRPHSNSGCTAALVMMVKEHDLQPERDYNWGFSYGHDTSIKWVAEKKTDAAAVASDILGRLTASGEVQAAAVREIYASEPFPGGVVGYAYNLKPDLCEGVRETLVTFEWSGTGLEKTYGPAGSAKFAPVSYKDDWAGVREINAASAEMAAKLGKPAA